MLEIAKRNRDGEAAPNSLSLGFLEQLYASYLRDPTSVSADWRRYFRQMGNGGGGAPRFGPSFRPASVFNPPPRGGEATAGVRELEMALLQDRVDQLVRAYRVRGHMVANIDPLGHAAAASARARSRVLRLHRSRHGPPFSTDTIHGPDVLTLARAFWSGCATPIAARSACSSCTSTT